MCLSVTCNARQCCKRCPSCDVWPCSNGGPSTNRHLLCRLFLSPYDLTPTQKNVSNRFSVKYMLNLVLVDEEDRRYFKQQEIQLYRLKEDATDSAQALPLVT